MNEAKSGGIGLAGILFIFAATACTTEESDPAVDASVSIDAGAPDSTSVDAAPTSDAYDPFGNPPTELCSDVCPDEELSPYYNPANSYVWSWCRPSYRRCIDPTAPQCVGCP